MSLSAPNSTLFNPDTLTTPDVLDPTQIRVVELESEGRGITRRFDCYELESEEKMFRLAGDEVQVCAVRWATTPGLDPEMDVDWTATRLSYWEVDQIRVFSWPTLELIRVYRDVE
ncbi:MAG: hypothetical protein BRD55_05150 [Bacteroidetes bacterium SW_9_63_38]|nr:MAG: hypothetical protein BRD55_05150 [Bacteroidetes bacterium SW_9_63_38]